MQAHSLGAAFIAALLAGYAPLAQSRIVGTQAKRERRELVAADFLSHAAQAIYAGHFALAEASVGRELPVETNTKVSQAAARLALIELYFDESLAASARSPITQVRVAVTSADTVKMEVPDMHANGLWIVEPVEAACKQVLPASDDVSG